MSRPDPLSNTGIRRTTSRPDPPEMTTPEVVQQQSPTKSKILHSSELTSPKPNGLPKKQMSCFAILLVVGLAFSFLSERSHMVSMATKNTKKQISSKPQHPKNKIVVNLGMPRTGTHSIIMAVKQLLEIDDPETEITGHHVFKGYHPDELTEFLFFGKQSPPHNPLLQQFTFDNATNNAVRIMADHPYFLLAPVAPDFPEHTYWIHVTRDVETHIPSFLYILEQFAWPRCRCGIGAPFCEGVNPIMTQLDRLFFNRHQVLGKLCESFDSTQPMGSKVNATKVPEVRDLARILLEEHTKDIQVFFQEKNPHLRYLHLRLEDPEDQKLNQIADFLGVHQGGNMAHYPQANQMGGGNVDRNKLKGISMH